MGLEHQQEALRKLAEDFKDKVLVYEPPLAQTIGRYERGEGRPLTEKEVLYLRNTEFCRFVSRDEALAIEQARGYPDIDHKNAWEAWRQLRAEMGLRPDEVP